MPNSLKYIGFHAFARCQALRTITIPDSVYYLGSYAFFECSIHELTLSKNISYISVGMFSYAKIELPEGVKHIDAFAFTYANEQREITIPGSINYISAKAFDLFNPLQRKKIYVVNEDVLKNVDTSFHGFEVIVLQP